MRKPQREPESVIEALKIACKQYPDQRVMQVIVNACGEDPFYCEDLVAVEKLIKYACEKHKQGLERL